MKVQPVSGKPQRFVPKLERLEDRTTPAVLITQTGSTLTITGNAFAETITINDNGAGGISVAGDVAAFSPVAANTQVNGIDRIVATLAGGNDVVTYNLFLPNYTTRMEVQMNLGVGNDTFLGQLSNRRMRSTGRLLLDIQGDAGTDTLTALASRHDVDPGGQLNVRLYGGASADTIMGTWNGRNRGRVIYSALGEDADDDIRVSMIARPGSTGITRGVVRGGARNDRLRLFLAPQPGPTGLVTGDAGVDQCTTTGTVTVLSCEA
jgi:hypothetical protein